MASSNLTEAKRAKNDEFYTQYADIEKEIMAYLEFNPEVFRGKTLLTTLITTLGIGIVTSLFSQLFATRFLFTILVEKFNIMAIKTPDEDLKGIMKNLDN